MFFSVFRGHFESFYFKDLVSYTHHTFDIFEGVPFQDCLVIMEKFLLYQTEHVLIQFADFSRELINAYIHYLKVSKIL